MKTTDKVVKQLPFFTVVASLMLVVLNLSNIRAIKDVQKNAVLQPVEETMVSKPQRIGVIGAGSLGGTVGKLLVKAGYEVMFSSRHPEELKSLTEELGPRASVGYPKDAAAFGEVILLSVPFEAVPQVARDLEKQIKGKIVLDATNPWYSSSQLAKEAAQNGIAKTTSKYFANSILVRVFSAVDATVLETSSRQKSKKVAVPIASDNEDAVAVAAQLVRDAGSEPVVVGNLESSIKFDPGKPGFRAHKTPVELRELLGLPSDNQSRLKKN